MLQICSEARWQFVAAWRRLMPTIEVERQLEVVSPHLAGSRVPCPAVWSGIEGPAMDAGMIPTGSLRN